MKWGILMKDLIIKELIENKSTFISGQEISNKYQITRAAVWKHIKKLKEEGYDIESVTNKGYRLIEEPDKLETAYLDFEKNWIIGKEYLYFKEIDSTNAFAKQIAMDKQEGTIILAEKQTKGKGRLGRIWTSDEEVGIYMTVILKPDMLPSDAVMMTQVAAAAVVKAMQDTFQCDAKIKWPSDIILDNKKVCGILTELSGEIESLNYIILGIGVNVNQINKDFTEELQDKATSIRICLGEKVYRKKLLLTILDNLNKMYKAFANEKSLDNVMDICRQHSATLGKDVRVSKNHTIIEGKAIDITDRGGLMIQDKAGNQTEIISGEVSVRGLYRYVD